MKQKLFNKDIAPHCAICKHGKLTPDGTEVICPKKGIVAADFLCGKYAYDVLKRTPRRMSFEELSDDTFNL
ncbi:MAG TPA: hypothetical protein GXZ23_05005 [Clostridiales bacterium]|jgi:hypothetical protein|nr:hypothetical protein [Clostridiales bacterium]